MRYFRRLPPLLRVASLVGLLSAIAGIALLTTSTVIDQSSFPYTYRDPNRHLSGQLFGSGFSLGLLALACAFAVNRYNTRFRRPDRRPFPLESWQSQVLAILLLAALPLCALALAVLAFFIQSTSLALSGLFLLLNAAINVLAGNVLFVAYIVALASRGMTSRGMTSRGPTPTPPPTGTSG